MTSKSRQQWTFVYLQMILRSSLKFAVQTSSEATSKNIYGSFSGRFQPHDGRGRPRATADRKDRLIVRSTVTMLDSSLSTIRRATHTNESRFQLCLDDHRRRVWRCPGQRADLEFTIARPTGPQSGIIVWSAISFDSRTPLVIIRGTLTPQRCVDDILRTVLLPFLLQHLGFIFQKIRPDHMWHVLLGSVLQLVKYFLGQPDRQISLQ
ncbi:transposable element Tc1 transposase [Trichonephila clavipes]|nr:transposable element Tc1 transposase [Trichonephila clavipes]